MSTWKYSRMYSHQAATPVNKVVDPTIPARIDAVLAQPINDWQRTFCTSIKASFERFKSLTTGQYDTFAKVEVHYSSDAASKRDEWNKNFSPEMMASWQLLIKYYSGTKYYQGVVARWKKDKSYIPNEGEYESICKNIYAQRMLKQVELPPRFSVGQIIVVHIWSSFKLATVIEVGEVSTPTKGSRIYKVANVGEEINGAYEIVEKNMLHYKPSLDKKITLTEPPF